MLALARKNRCHQISNTRFLSYIASNLILAGAPSQTLLGKFTALSQITYLDFRDPTSTGREERKNGEKEKRNKSWGKEKKTEMGEASRKKGRKGRRRKARTQIRYDTGSDEPLAASGTPGDLTWFEDFLTSIRNDLAPLLRWRRHWAWAKLVGVGHRPAPRPGRIFTFHTSWRTTVSYTHLTLPTNREV